MIQFSIMAKIIRKPDNLSTLFRGINDIYFCKYVIFITCLSSITDQQLTLHIMRRHFLHSLPGIICGLSALVGNTLQIVTSCRQRKIKPIQIQQSHMKFRHVITRQKLVQVPAYLQVNYQAISHSVIVTLLNDNITYFSPE